MELLEEESGLHVHRWSKRARPLIPCSAVNLSISSNCNDDLLLRTREHGPRGEEWGCREDRFHTGCLTPRTRERDALRGESGLLVGQMNLEMRAAKDVRPRDCEGQ